jgi:broad specificity phosphatase PhoE
LWILKIFSPEQFFIAKREKNHPRRIMIMNMKRIIVVWSMLLMLALTLLAGCASSSGSSQNSALSADNINLIFVVSPDLLYNSPGDIDPDIDPDTANLTNKGLNRSLQMATFLKQQVLGGNNVTAIYALSPMTHLQNANKYSNIPDMTAIGFIQQFALLNQINLIVDDSGGTYTGNNYPLFAAYGELGGVPSGVVVPSSYIPGAQGLTFNDDASGNNIALVTRIINANQSGFYVFSAPWETIKALMTKINTQYVYNLNLPTTYLGSNFVYVISITPSPSESASLVTYNSNLTPPSTYPVLPAPVASAACTNNFQPYFSTVLTGGVGGVVIPSNANTNQTIYIVRHAEAHPDPAFGFEDGNYVAAGQWRALSLANALNGKIRPTMVYSIDPAQSYSLPYYLPISLPDYFSVSYARPSLTVLPYAIANKLPFYLAASFEIGTIPTVPLVAQNTSNFFFTHSVGGTGVDLSGQIILLAWESGHIRPFLNALLASYVLTNPPQILPIPGAPAGSWPDADYDTIWTVILDRYGNLTVHNAFCEGIDSTSLPATAPQF